MPDKVIPSEVLDKIRHPGSSLLSAPFSRCFEKKLAETYGDGIMMDFSIGESFILPEGKGKITFKVDEDQDGKMIGKIIAPTQVLLDDVYEKLILCAGVESTIPLPEIQKKVADRQRRDAMRGLVGKFPLPAAAEVARSAATGIYGGSRKTRKGKKKSKKTRKSLKHRRQ